jgi:hypothetical protein
MRLGVAQRCRSEQHAHDVIEQHADDDILGICQDLVTAVWRRIHGLKGCGY